METQLHRQLKAVYADEGSQLEVPLGKYRIDVVRGDELIEIQHGTLAAIRDKTRDLLRRHRVRVVKPLICRKQLVKLRARGGEVVGRRTSPKRGSVLDVFDELVHFTQVFPHANLTIEVLLVDIEERRYPGHGRRRWRRKTDHIVDNQRLVDVRRCVRLRRAVDLLKLMSVRLPDSFGTADLAAALDIPRTQAQRIAYCLRETGAVSKAGKDGNAWLYRRCA